MSLLDLYVEHCGPEEVRLLRQMGAMLEGQRLVHVNSTRRGGGVAEILERLVPLQRELGIDSNWEGIEGDPAFFEVTKAFHNALQGKRQDITDSMFAAYEAANLRNWASMRDKLEDADFVFIHDPQPAMLASLSASRRGKWIWRCHIDASNPDRKVWRYLAGHVSRCDAAIFSLPDFAQPLEIPAFIIPPAIDPVSPKNQYIPPEECESILRPLGIDLKDPSHLVIQVSRFDRFKDPLGVMRACELASRQVNLRLVLAGGGADDDPEGAAVLEEVYRRAERLPFAKVLLLPPDAHRVINSLQRSAQVVFQKSTREGFGLTVSEALWKGKPVIGGDTGGIRLQVLNQITGYRVQTPEGGSMRLVELLNNPKQRERMGKAGRELVKEHFLITRLLRNHLSLMLALNTGTASDRVEVL
ncbi:MAG: glycosyltransferase [Thermanaerothrix sp.]|nr:glycosyltransferase [Thermanaerothrix sp.]